MSRIDTRAIDRVSALDKRAPNQKYHLFFQKLNTYVLTQPDDASKIKAFYELLYALHTSTSLAPARHSTVGQSHATVFNNIVTAIFEGTPNPHNAFSAEMDAVASSMTNTWLSRFVAVSAAAELYRDGGKYYPESFDGVVVDQCTPPANGQGKLRVENFLLFLSQIANELDPVLREGRFWSLIHVLFQSSSTMLKAEISSAISWPAGYASDRRKEEHVSLLMKNSECSRYAHHIVNPKKIERLQRQGISVERPQDTFFGLFESGQQRTQQSYPMDAMSFLKHA